MARLLIPGLRAYRVTDGFLAGSYPGGRSEEDARERLMALLRHDVSVFINLMEEGEQYHYGGNMEDYDALLPEITRHMDAFANDPPQMIRFAVRDMAVPDSAHMRRILDAIDGTLEQGKRMYVHCLGGVGRTGTVVGCWLSRHGIAGGSEALHEINRLREFDPTLDLPSPQTEEQRRMVRGWSAGE